MQQEKIGNHGYSSSVSENAMPNFDMHMHYFYGPVLFFCVAYLSIVFNMYDLQILALHIDPITDYSQMTSKYL